MLLRASAAALAEMIARREVSSLEVAEAHLGRIALVNPGLNAVIQLAPDALERAREADAVLASGAAVGPFHGVPFTVKDWIEAKGLICAAGFAERRDHRPTRDAVVLTRMKEAGAILLGKTNVTQGAPVYGRPNNPVDSDRTPGSSSSGEAAIIAAGGSPMGLASDSGGSIRWPAHCCGVAALKPSSGRVPNTGHFPRIGHLSDPRTVIGPMARAVTDLEPILRVISGEDPGDPGAAPVALGRARDVDLNDLRVGWFASAPGAEVDTATARAVGDAAVVLAGHGCRVNEIAGTWLEDSLAITRSYWARRRSLSLRDWTPFGPPRLDEASVERSVFEWERFCRRPHRTTSGTRRSSYSPCPTASPASPPRSRPLAARPKACRSESRSPPGAGATIRRSRWRAPWPRSSPRSGAGHAPAWRLRIGR